MKEKIPADDVIDVLDHGFVRLVESLGDDSSVVQAARVSFGQGSKGAEKDRQLIRYLAKHKHGTPFEMVVFKFHVSCPIFVMRQWIRHRVGSFNEISARYSEMEDKFYLPTVFRTSSATNKQGSSDENQLDHNEIHKKVSHITAKSFSTYKELIAMGVAKEMARMVLPVSLYTEFYWAVNARSLMNFLELRMESHAQWEIQQYANAVFQYFAKIVPNVAQDFAEYTLKPLGISIPTVSL